MTREDAIDILENEKMCVNNETCQREECATCSLVMDKDKILTALDMALSALRPVSRERVRRGTIIETIKDGRMNRVFSCCSRDFTELTCWYMPDFCPACGAPMTDEAAQMVIERLEALKDGKGD